jgi:hypothetical protein
LFTLIFFGAALLIIVFAGLLMPWHATQGEKRGSDKSEDKRPK